MSIFKRPSQSASSQPAQTTGGRIISFDLDKALEYGKIIGEELPGIMPLLETLGIALPGGAAKYVPLVGHPQVQSLISRLAGGNTGVSGLSKPGMPNLGPLGKGRLSYLLSKNKGNQRDDGTVYTDSDVVSAVQYVISDNFPMSPEVYTSVSFVMRTMFPDAKGVFTDAMQRAAVDRIIEDDGMSRGTCDRLGDMIWFALNSETPTPAP